MKNSLRLLFILTLMTLCSFTSVNALSLKNIPSWPHDHIQDEVKLFPFGEELKFNFFLDRVLTKEKVFIRFDLLQSLEGLSLEERSASVMDEILKEHEAAIVFTLSLSDRQFKIAKSPLVDLSEDDLNHLVKATIPALTSQKYAEGIRLFLQNALFKINGMNQMIPPVIGAQKRESLNILIFFGTLLFLVFFLGHKLRKSAPISEIDSELKAIKKTKNQTHGIFWS